MNHVFDSALAGAVGHFLKGYRMTEEWKQKTHAPDETRQLGKKLGKLLQPGDVVLLAGQLGAGKTHFAQGIAAGLGISDSVTSPTFTLIAEYDGRVPFTHMDLYRLYEDPIAADPLLAPGVLEQIAFDDYFDGTQVVLIEWPEAVRRQLDAYLFVHIAYDDMGGETSRELTVFAEGRTAKERLQEWVAAWV